MVSLVSACLALADESSCVKLTLMTQSRSDAALRQQAAFTLQAAQIVILSILCVSVHNMSSCGLICDATGFWISTLKSHQAVLLGLLVLIFSAQRPVARWKKERD